MTIGVTGSTGQLGRLVVAKLKEKIGATDIVALARSSAKSSNLHVTVREADYSNPETLDQALQGIDTLLLISSSEVGRRAEQHRNVINAARKSGVKWIVYTSLLHADTSAISMLAEEHLATEADVKASGIPFTILRNGWYTENYMASVPAAAKGGAFLGCADGGKISSAARVDYADAAVTVLTSDQRRGRTYELAGDDAWTLPDLADEISRQTGRTIPYKDLAEDEYTSVLESFGLPKPMAAAYANFDAGASRGALFENGRQLSRLIGRSTTPLSFSVAHALRDGQ